MDDVARGTRAPSRAYASYVLGVLVVVYVTNYVDRQLLSIQSEPIEAELGASDKVLGAFAYWRASQSYAAELAASG